MKKSIFLKTTLVIATLLLTTVTFASAANLVKNPGFEGPLTTWFFENPSGGSLWIENTPAVVKKGKHSLGIENIRTTPAEPWKSQLYTLIPGITYGIPYKASFWIYSDASQKKIQFGIQENGGTWTDAGLYSEIILNQGWNFIDETFIASITIPAARLFINFGLSTGKVWLDEFWIAQSNEQPGSTYQIGITVSGNPAVKYLFKVIPKNSGTTKTVSVPGKTRKEIFLGSGSYLILPNNQSIGLLPRYEDLVLDGVSGSIETTFTLP